MLSCGVSVRRQVKTIQMIEDPSCEHIKMQLEARVACCSVFCRLGQDGIYRNLNSAATLLALSN